MTLCTKDTPLERTQNFGSKYLHVMFLSSEATSLKRTELFGVPINYSVTTVQPVYMQSYKPFCFLVHCALKPIFLDLIGKKIKLQWSVPLLVATLRRKNLKIFDKRGKHGPKIWWIW